MVVIDVFFRYICLFLSMYHENKKKTKKKRDPKMKKKNVCPFCHFLRLCEFVLFIYLFFSFKSCNIWSRTEKMKLMVLVSVGQDSDFQLSVNNNNSQGSTCE